MPSKGTFHLLIPNLLDSLKIWNQDFLFEPITPNLSKLFAKYSRIKYPYITGLNDAFFHLLGLENQPTAFYRYKAQTGIENYNVICADPIHLEVSMNDVTLTKKIIDLCDDEAMEIIHNLNQVFTGDDIEFVFGSNQSWYAKLPDNEMLNSHDIDTVLLQNIMGKLPISNKRNWHVLQNEIQMLLHASDVNRHRESAGLVPVNSLWFWGSGNPIVSKIKIGNVYSNNNLSETIGKTYAHAANCEWQVLPENSKIMIDKAYNSQSLNVIVLNQLFTPASQDDTETFQRQLTEIDQYIKPLLDAWQKNQIDIVIDCCDGTVLTPEKIPNWNFWLKPKKLREVANETH